MNTTGYTGNARIQAQLQGPLTHAYLISSEKAAERQALADLMARALVCDAPDVERPCNVCMACDKASRGIHPDIIYRAPAEGKAEIPVATVREMVQDAPTLPNEAERKVYIVEEADGLNPNAQNAFLKLLEEPPSFVTFLLLAENPLALLPTVRSRCVHLGLAPEIYEAPVVDGEVQALVDGFLAAVAKGGVDMLPFCIGLEKVERQTLLAFVPACYAALVAALGREAADRSALLEAAALFDSLRTDLQFNVGTGHISGKILATLI